MNRVIPAAVRAPGWAGNMNRARPKSSGILFFEPSIRAIFMQSKSNIRIVKRQIEMRPIVILVGYYNF